MPEKTFTISAVDSARPSIRPTVRALAPSAVTRKTGNRPWISSEEVSISRLTNPRAQMLAGIRTGVFGELITAGTLRPAEDGNKLHVFCTTLLLIPACSRVYAAVGGFQLSTSKTWCPSRFVFGS